MRRLTVIVLCLLAGNAFGKLPNFLGGNTSYQRFPPSGPSNTAWNPNDCPTEGSPCSPTDVLKTRAALGTCTAFLECKSDSIWTKVNCPEGNFYTEVLQECVPPGEADCAAGLFGCQSKVIVESSGVPLSKRSREPFYKRIGKPFHRQSEEPWVVRACQGCYSKTTCSSSAAAVGAQRLPGDIWSQTVVAARLANSDFYSFAFDRIKDGEFTVLTEIVTPGMMMVWSKLYKRNPSPESNTWKVVPTADSPWSGYYRIVSTRTQRALTLAERLIGDDKGRLNHALELRDLNEKDGGQLWRFDRVNEN